MIVIVDYGLGNLGSIVNMLKKVGFRSEIIKDPKRLDDASHIILPGVGAFDSGMRHLEEFDWIGLLNQKVLVEKIPTLGICLGMQLMTKSSEEGMLPGLGWVDAHTKKFVGPGLRVPHLGWNITEVSKPSKLLP